MSKEIIEYSLTVGLCKEGCHILLRLQHGSVVIEEATLYFHTTKPEDFFAIIEQWSQQYKLNKEELEELEVKACHDLTVAFNVFFETKKIV